MNRSAIIACLVAGLAGASEAPAGTAQESRDSLWRSIFARPANVPHPLSNPATPEKTALGSELFRDSRLSKARDRNCSSCHNPQQGFSNGEKKGVGIDGKSLQRNVPALYSLAWGTSFYWDGREPTLEAQARVPITAANEMGGETGLIVDRLASDPKMKAKFAAAFPDEPTVNEINILKAIAAYERTLVAPKTRFDQWVEGDDSALSQEELLGFSIFVGKGGCVACHGGWRFTDDAFHDIGVRSDDPGRGAVPGGTPGLAQFKTPSLRESLHTAPYMHDGSLPTLADVVAHYSGALEKRPSLAANVRRDLALVPQEKEALVAFLRTLSSEGNSD